MSHTNKFVIKVGDLLRNPGRIDTMELDTLMLDHIDGLSEQGLS